MTAFRIRCCFLGLALWTLAGAAWAQGYDAGMRAYDTGRFAKALEIWGPLAEGGDPIAQYSLGKLLENGGGRVERDVIEAAKWYERAANQGVASAQNNLGLMYAQGSGVPRDLEHAARLWMTAAEKDHPIAQFNLGLAYFRGEGIAKNQDMALRWFRRAAELGLAQAQFAVGQVTRLGLAGPADSAEALRWYELAAAQGHPEAKDQIRKLREADEAPKVTPAPGPTTVATASQEAVAEAPAPPIKPAAKPTPSPAVQRRVEPTGAAQPAPEPAPQPTPQPAAVEKPSSAPPAPSQTQIAAATRTITLEGTVQPRMASVLAAPVASAPDLYGIWLISMKDEAEASSYLQAAQARHPQIFAEAQGAVVPADLGKGGRFHRVVAGGLPDRQAARDLCRRLRAADPGAFCKVLAR